MSLTFRNARTTVENLLVDRLAEAYALKMPVAADVATLRARASSALPEQLPKLVYVTAAGFLYRWRSWSTLADNGTTVIKPNDKTGSLPGRWIRTSSTTQTGYLEVCDLYNDDDNSEDVIEERIYGKKPALLVSWVRTEHKAKSHRPGALYWGVMHFQILAVCESLRGEQYTRQGSGSAAEAAKDPGTAAILGDVKELLAGMAGEVLGEADVAHIEIGDEETVLKDLARRTFVEAIAIEVRFTNLHPDTDTIALADPFEFENQLQLAQTQPGATFDSQNYVTAGLGVPLGASLTQTIDGGEGFIAGAAFTANPTAKTFTASKATYRYLHPNGAWVFVETEFGQDRPTTPAGTMLVGVTLTDGSAVKFDRILADSLINYGPVDEVENPWFSSYMLSLDPVLYWQFRLASGSTISDASGNGNDGTLDVGVTVAYQRPSLVAEVGDYALGATDQTAGGVVVLSGLGIGGAERPFSVVWLYKPNGVIDASDGSIGQAGGSSRFQARATGAAGALLITGSGGTNFTTPDGVYQAGTKVLCIYTFDGTNGRFYKNGALVSGPNAMTHNAWVVFAWNPSLSWDGDVDEVAVLPHCLSAAEAAALQAAI